MFGKCRRLIDSYKNRKDLAEQKWLKAHEVLDYLNLANDELLKRIASGEIKAKSQKDGTVIFCVSGAWQYDNCFLAAGGGQCLYFGPHNGQTISCLMELKGLDTREHPNYSRGPTAESKAGEDVI
jgi:hypothetical protein